jgi:hypothetical protein
LHGRELSPNSLRTQWSAVRIRPGAPSIGFVDIFDDFGPAISLRNCAVFLETQGQRIEPVRADQQQVVSVAAASRLGRQLEELIASLSKVDARFALIGGLALASHKVIRATQDIDLLTDSEKAEDIDRELVALGYQCLHRSPDAGNYLFNRESLLEQILQ